MTGKFSTGPRPDQEQTDDHGGAPKLRPWEKPGQLIDLLVSVKYNWWIRFPARPDRYIAARRNDDGTLQLVFVLTHPGTLDVRDVRTFLPQVFTVGCSSRTSSWFARPTTGQDFRNAWVLPSGEHVTSFR